MCFTFPARPNVKILDKVNLTIQPNSVSSIFFITHYVPFCIIIEIFLLLLFTQITAIVGRSGSGVRTIQKFSVFALVTKKMFSEKYYSFTSTTVI